MQNYPLSIRIVVESLLCVLCIPVDKARCESTEHTFRRILVKGGIYERLMLIEFTPEVYERMRLFRENAMYRPHLVNKSSALAASLCTWMLRELDETASQYNIMSPVRGSKDFSLGTSTDRIKSSSTVKRGDDMVSLSLGSDKVALDTYDVSKSSTFDSEDLATGQAVSESISFMELPRDNGGKEMSSRVDMDETAHRPEVDLPNQVQPYIEKVSPKKRGPVQLGKS